MKEEKESKVEKKFLEKRKKGKEKGKERGEIFFNLVEPHGLSEAACGCEGCLRWKRFSTNLTREERKFVPSDIMQMNKNSNSDPILCKRKNIQRIPFK